MITRGDPVEKLEFAFNLYDIDQNGFISKKELGTIVAAFSNLLGGLKTVSGDQFDEDHANDFVEEFFKAMDINQDGMLSKDEYIEGAMKNEDIATALKLFQ
eukprot:TRINITY_DN3997_c0_g1_i2.p1 TRINITY_DN3997_c0_g1~~TRINITY_DN3997_c0_g1_i2.p1  ORF type:complete len:101 (-),score=42.12 TRINITY_DN3997_c0_g1_i2:36-338(-)